jgi:RNA methyltransferase, TrmH family
VTFHSVITSPDNVQIKYVHALQKKRVRYQEQRFVIEGLRLVAHALQRGHRPALVLYTSAFASSPEGHSLVETLLTSMIPLWEVAPSLLSLLSDTVTPQGILAVADMPAADPAVLPSSTLLLIVDALRDPGNLGTILRTAQATHVEAVLLSEGCVDPFAPKVVRAGMGAQFDLPLFCDLPWSEIRRLAAGKKCILADARGSHTPWELDWTVPLALIVSSEADGASPGALALSECRVRLPMAPGVESLNVAIAAAVLLFEAEHQRHRASR